MAQRKKNGKVAKAEFKRFVNIPLPNTVTVDILEKAAGERDTDDLLLDLWENGYKVSLSPLRDGSGVCVSATGHLEGGKNAGYCTTCFAGTPRRGVLAVWYKLAIMNEWREWQVREVEKGLEI